MKRKKKQEHKLGEVVGWYDGRVEKSPRKLENVPFNASTTNEN